MASRSPALLLALIVALCAIACGDTKSPSATTTPTPELPTEAPTPIPTATPIDTSVYPANAIGYAISWPQCGKAYPDEPFDFGIIGVTDGRALTRNPCFEDEYRWAERGQYHPSIYMNTNYREGALEIRGCGDDPSCVAHQYGWLAAQDAYQYAASVDGVAPVWWLDVQITSDWSNDVTLNADSIRGAADFLQSKGIRVGISSTSFQWAQVAGDALHNVPIWDASALDADMARTFCQDGKDFGGGGTEQIAYVEQFETVVACGETAAATPAP